MIPTRLFIGVLILFFSITVNAQDNLEAMLMDEMDAPTEYEYGSFLSTYLLNNQSTEMLNKHGIGFRISHKLGSIKSGADHFYGFDNANSFMEANYAPFDFLNIGLGRATLSESLSGYSKLRLTRQTSGARVMPVSLVLLMVANCTTQQYDDIERNKNLSERFQYTTQLLISHKFNQFVSAQLIPTYIHRNLVDTKADINDVLAIGIGATFRIEKSLRFNAEYFVVQNHNTPNKKYYNPLSLGICYQTSRHAFELFVTNSNGITENDFIVLTNNNLWEGDLRIGFNISTVFSLKPNR